MLNRELGSPTPEEQSTLSSIDAHVAASLPASTSQTSSSVAAATTATVAVLRAENDICCFVVSLSLSEDAVTVVTNASTTPLLGQQTFLKN